MWQTESNAGWEAGADSPPTNMMYTLLWAISAEPGTTAGTHGQRATTISLAIAARDLVFGMSTTAPAPSTQRRARCCGGESRVAGQRIPDTPVVDGRQHVVEGTPTDGNALRWNAMPPELRPSRQARLRLHAAVGMR